MTKARLSAYKPYLDWIGSQCNTMTRHLFSLADINSGSLNLQGLKKLTAQIEKLLLPLGGQMETVSLKPLHQVTSRGEVGEVSLGKAVRVIKRPEAAMRVFLGIHMDTVFPEDSPFQKTHKLDDGRISGPGVADAKGGIMVMITALEAFEQTPWAKNIGWEILLNPDEEIGSPGSAPLLEESAKRCHLGLLFEPPFPDGSLVSNRKGSGNFTAVVRGKSAHAGRDFHEGRNAIRALSDFTQAVDNLNGQRDGVTLNPGFIQGGGPINIVPDLAILKFNVRFSQQGDEEWLRERLEKERMAINGRDGLSLELFGGFDRKPRILPPAGYELLQLVAGCGKELGIKIEWRPTGGCSDGNNLAAAGLVNVDNLGVRGGNTHTETEFMYPDSLVERAGLSALFLMKLSSGEISWQKDGIY